MISRLWITDPSGEVYNINKQYAHYNTKSTGDCKATKDATLKSLLVLNRVDHKTLTTVE